MTGKYVTGNERKYEEESKSRQNQCELSHLHFFGQLAELLIHMNVFMWDI